MRVPGIVISATKTRPKPVKVCIRCNSCGAVRFIAVAAGFETAALPRT